MNVICTILADRVANDSHVVRWGWAVKAAGVTETRLCSVPDLAQTQVLAEAMASALGASLAPSVHPSDVVRALGWRYRMGSIGSGVSTIESLLVPLNRGGFSVVVNAQRLPSPERAMWLTAHEIGHSFFYKPGSPPRRIVAVTAEEEHFCDAFADCLLSAARKNDRPKVTAA